MTSPEGRTQWHQIETPVQSPKNEAIFVLCRQEDKTEISQNVFACTDYSFLPVIQGNSC